MSFFGSTNWDTEVTKHREELVTLLTNHRSRLAELKQLIGAAQASLLADSQDSLSKSKKDLERYFKFIGELTSQESKVMSELQHLSQALQYQKQ